MCAHTETLSKEKWKYCIQMKSLSTKTNLVAGNIRQQWQQKYKDREAHDPETKQHGKT